MNREVKKLLAFTGLLALGLMVSHRVNEWYYRNYNYQVPTGVKTLVTGSSLVTNGINPALLPHAENIALAAEPLVLSYYKLKDILPHETQLENVVISYSMLDVAYDWDHSFIDGKKNSGEMIRRLIGLRDKFHINEVKDCFDVDFLIWWEQILRYRVFPNIFYWIEATFANRMDYAQIGGYNPQVGSLNIEKCDFKKMAAKHFPLPKSEGAPVYGKMNCYLDSIICLCDQLDLKLYVIGMPMPKELYVEVPDSYREYYNDQTQKLTKMPNVSYIGFSNWNLGCDMYMDFSHLNKMGSDSLSSCINRLMNKKIGLCDFYDMTLYE